MALLLTFMGLLKLLVLGPLLASERQLVGLRVEMVFMLLVELLSLGIAEGLRVGDLGELVGLALMALLLVELVRFGFI